MAFFEGEITKEVHSCSQNSPNPSPATSWGLHFSEHQFPHMSNGAEWNPPCGTVVKMKEVMQKALSTHTWHIVRLNP